MSSKKVRMTFGFLMFVMCCVGVGGCNLYIENADNQFWLGVLLLFGFSGAYKLISGD